MKTQIICFMIYIFEQILLDFDVRFNTPRNIFLQKWNRVKGNIKSVHSSKVSTQNEIPSQFGEEVEQVLLLLQMLPDVPKGRKSSKKRWIFAESVEKFIVFSPVIHLAIFLKIKFSNSIFLFE